MKPDRRWAAFWAALAAIAIAGEALAIATNGATDSFSAMVWFVVDFGPWVRWPLMLGFGAGASWLAVHFFSRRKP